MRMRTPTILLQVVAPASRPAERAAPRAGQREREGRARGEERAPPGVRPAPHRPPAYARLGAEPLRVAHGGDASREQATNDEGLGQVRHPREMAHAHPEVV